MPASASTASATSWFNWLSSASRMRAPASADTGALASSAGAGNGSAGALANSRRTVSSKLDALTGLVIKVSMPPATAPPITSSRP